MWSLGPLEKLVQLMGWQIIITSDMWYQPIVCKTVSEGYRKIIK